MAAFFPIPIQQVRNIQYLNFNFPYSVPSTKIDQPPEERTGVIERYAGTVDIDYDKIRLAGAISRLHLHFVSSPSPA